MSARKASTADAALARLPVGDHFAAADVPGLVLRKREALAGTWLLRQYENGRRHVVSLGAWPGMDLRAAREMAQTVRAVAASGGDWREALLQNRMTHRARSFAWCAARFAASMQAGWSRRHAQQWISTVRRFAFPALGAMDVSDIRREHVLSVLRPIWTTHTQTAARLRQRIEAVIDYARALGVMRGDNPAAWKGGLKALLPAPSRVRMVRHHPAVDHRHAPAVFAHLWGRARGGCAEAVPLLFLMLTASRAGEVRGLRISELDMERRLWVIPAERMKARKEHRIPLTEWACTLLQASGRDAWPGGQRLPADAMVKTLRETLTALGLPADATVHGMRSTFRDWAGEETRHGREIIEQALAHKLQDAVEAAYARGDLLAKRAALMSDWADYLTSKIPATIEPPMGQQPTGNQQEIDDASK